MTIEFGLQIVTGILLPMVLFAMRGQTHAIEKLRSDINGISQKTSKEIAELRDDFKHDLESQRKEHREDLKEARAELSARDDLLAAALTKAIESLPRTYAFKDDQVMFMTSIDRKIDALSSQICQLSNDLNKHVGREADA